jgi:hypothetical protein
MRQHSIKTSYLIHKTLVSDNDLLELVPEENIQLLFAQEGTTFPHVLITRTGIRSERGNKDFIGDIVNFNILVVSDKYEVGADIADTIRFDIENHILQDSEIDIRLENIILTGASERMSYDAFIQEMNFSAEVIKP